MKNNSKEFAKPNYVTDRLKSKTRLMHSKNIVKFGFDFHPQVSIVSGLLVLLFVGITIYSPQKTGIFLAQVKTLITTKFNWFFILSANASLVYPIYLMFSKLGDVKLGGPEAKPEYKNFAWYSMLLSAGMGIGLMFYSVAEPLLHFHHLPPMIDKSTAGSALGITFYHWGLHPWGMYTLVGLSLAFFHYNRGLPLSLRSAFYPIFKNYVFGWVGDAIDILAVISCLFGLATSLGLGAQQINAGLHYIFGIPQTPLIQLIIIVLITIVATISVVSGVSNGVRILSELNIRVAFIFMILILVLGPTIFILRSFNNGLGYYLNNIVSISFFTQNKGEWQGTWTIFYWAWWISWSPFVGIFIARISKGRTVREFVSAILIVPTLLSFIWMSTFGGTSLFLSHVSNTLITAVDKDLSTSLFAMIHLLNIPMYLKIALCVVGTFLIIAFFITSSDSGSLVVDSLTSGGKTTSPTFQRIFWASLQGAVAMTLLMIGGKKALVTLQTGVIISGLPFAVVLLAMIYSLQKGLNKDLNKLKNYRQDKLANKLFNKKIIQDQENPKITDKLLKAKKATTSKVKAKVTALKPKSKK